MSIFGARASDWHSGRADIHPGAWIAAFIVVAVLYVLAVGFAGSLVNGNGSPNVGVMQYP